MNIGASATVGRLKKALLLLGAWWLILPVSLSLRGPVGHCAWAAKPDAGKPLSDEAAALFKDGKFLQAAELFERAFALSPDKLVRLRNAGRAYEEAGRLEYARLLFDRYLQQAPPGPERQEVVERVAKLDQRIAAAKADAARAEAARSAPVGPSAEPTPAALAEAAQPPARTLAWTAVAAGAAVAAGGVGWVAYVVQKHDLVEAAAGRGEYDYPQGGLAKLKSDRQAVSVNRALAWSTVGVGAAAALLGSLWAMWPDAPPRVAVIPWSSGGGASLALRF